MSPGLRLYVLVLGLAAAGGWMSGLVLLPLAAWAFMEAGICVASRLPLSRRRATAV
jgi:hypothetical protein